MAGFSKRATGYRRSDILLFVQEQQAAAPPAPEGHVYRPLDRADFDRDPIFLEKDRRDTFIARLMSGHRCHGHVRSDGAVASYQWVSDGATDAPFQAGLRLHIPAGHRYIWDCRTASWAERRGLYRQALQTLAAETASVKWIICEADNPGSAHGILNAGYRQAGQMRIIRLGPLCRLQDGNTSTICRSALPLSFRTWGKAGLT